MITTLIAIATGGVCFYLGTKLEERRPKWNDKLEQHVKEAVSAAVREVRREMND